MKLKNFLIACMSAYIGVLVVMPDSYNDARVFLLCTVIGLATAWLDYVWLDDLGSE